MHVHNRKKNISVFGNGLTDELGDITLTTETEHAISFSEEWRKFCLSLQCNGINSFFWFLMD